MTDIDFILITQSETVDYGGYSKLPLDRIELYNELIFPRMVYYDKAFRSHLDIINILDKGVSFNDADYPKRRELLNIWNLPSMNGLHLANYLLQYGIRTKVINNFDAEWDIFRDTYGSCKIEPLVGISTTFHLSYKETGRISRMIRDSYPSARIAAGGAFVNEQFINGRSRDFEKPMRKYGIDHILFAFNSEPDLKELILDFKKGGRLGKARNLAYIEDGDFERGAFKLTAEKWNDPVLDDAPLLWDKLEHLRIHRTVQMRSSSGCPFSCAFCSYPKTAKRFSPMSCGSFEKHLQCALRIPGVRNIIFIDDTLNTPPARFKDMCRMFRKYDFEWFSFLRVQFMNEETVKLMKESGCRGVYLGIESANDAVLTNMNKKADASQYLKGLELLKKYGITSIAAFIIGFPGETGESIKDDIRFIDNSGIDFYTLKEFYYMAHTPVHERRREHGLSGMGANWRHDTMDHKTAGEKKIEMFRAIKNSVFIDPDTSLWHIAYLYDQGYSIDAISGIQEGINEVMLNQIDGVYDDAHPSFKRLKGLFAGEAVNK